MVNNEQCEEGNIKLRVFSWECASVSNVRRIVPLLSLNKRRVVAINSRPALFIVLETSLVSIITGFVPATQDGRQLCLCLLVLIRVILWIS